MNIKKIAASFLAAVMVSSSLAIGSFALDIGVAEGTLDEETGLLYVPLEDGTLLATIPDGTQLSGDIVIPETFGEGDDAKTVTQIHSNLIYCPDTITSLSIPKTVVSLNYDNGIFSSWGDLKSITVDEENTAFSSDDGVLFNKDKTGILKYPFRKSGAGYSIPSTVVTVADDCFVDSELQSITIPDSVKTLGWGAFWNCKSLTELNIPKGVETINGGVIMHSGVSKITVDSENTNYCAVDNVLFTADKKTLVAFPIASDVEEYSIPDGTETILSDVFAGNMSLKAVKIPESVSIMREYTFNGCGIISAEIPGKVTEIRGTFMGCKSLESVTLPLSITKIGEQTFSNCTSLKTINYAGTQEDWDKIEIDPVANEGLNNATINFSDGTTGGTELTDVVQKPEVTENEDGTKDFTPGVKKNITTTDADIETMKAITANAPADAFDDDVVMNVSHDTFSGSGNSFAVDVSFVNPETNEKVQPKAGTKVTVKIPVPESLKNAESIFVYHVNDDGKAEKVEAKTETINGVKYVVFEADKFSVYALTDTAVSEETTTPSTPDTSTPSAPDTSAPSTSAPASSTVGSASFPNAAGSGSTSGEPASSESTGGDSGFSESANSTPASSSTGTAAAPENNPGTGIALSFVPLIAAAGAVVACKKLKK